MTTHIDIVVPMAGRGSRFVTAGYAVPKPLIEVGGKPMVELVIENLRPTRPHRFVFLCLKEHLVRYEMERILEDKAPGSLVIGIDTVTEGAACTVLLARDAIDGDQALMIANSDQWVDFSVDRYLDVQDDGDHDGLIMTMWADHPKWSFVRLDAMGRIIEVVEKQVVSNEATVGVNFARGSDFVRAADAMVKRDLRVNGEFYVAPVYNQLLEEGADIAYRNVGRVGSGMWGLGTPEDLQAFVVDPILERAVSGHRQI